MDGGAGEISTPLVPGSVGSNDLSRRVEVLEGLSEAMAGRADGQDADLEGLRDRLLKVASFVAFDVPELRKSLKALSEALDVVRDDLSTVKADVSKLAAVADDFNAHRASCSQRLEALRSRQADLERTVDTLAEHNGFICDWVGAVHDHLESISAAVDGPLAGVDVGADLSDDDIELMVASLGTPPMRG